MDDMWRRALDRFSSLAAALILSSDPILTAAAQERIASERFEMQMLALGQERSEAARYERTAQLIGMETVFSNVEVLETARFVALQRIKRGEWWMPSTEEQAQQWARTMIAYLAADVFEYLMLPELVASAVRHFAVEKGGDSDDCSAGEHLEHEHPGRSVSGFPVRITVRPPDRDDD